MLPRGREGLDDAAIPSGQRQSPATGGGLCAGFRAAARAKKQAGIAEFGNNVEALRKVRDSAQGDVLPTRTRLEKLLKSVV